MNNKVAVITGGGKNIGLDITKNFIEQGYDVCITGRNKEEIENIATSLKNENKHINVFGFPLELSNLESIKNFVNEVSKKYKKIDALICNAGNLGLGFDIFNTKEEDFDNVFDTNVKGNFFLIQNIYNLIKGGSIVLISSVQSKGAVEGRTVYGSSKGALNTMCKYLAYDLAPFNIRVNTVIVGAVHTDRWDKLTDEVCDKRRANYPIGREATAKEVADAVLYLAGDLSKATTGSEITVDSGLLLNILSYKDRKNHLQ